MKPSDCPTIYVPNADIEAHSRKYWLAFVVYLAVWVAGILFQLWFFANKPYVDMTDPLFRNAPAPALFPNSRVPDIGLLLAWLAFYWPLILEWHPIRFTPYWETPEYKARLDANPPW